MDLKEFYTSMQDFVKKDEFNTHIRKDGIDMDKIEEKLKFGKNDVMKTECPIVIAGEKEYLTEPEHNNDEMFFVL